MANTPMTTKTSAEIIAMFQRRKVRSRPGTTGTISHGCSSKSSDRFIEDSLRKGRINAPKTDGQPRLRGFRTRKATGKIRIARARWSWSDVQPVRSEAFVCLYKMYRITIWLPTLPGLGSRNAIRERALRRAWAVGNRWRIPVVGVSIVDPGRLFATSAVGRHHPTRVRENPRHGVKTRNSKSGEKESGTCSHANLLFSINIGTVKPGETAP